MQTHQNKNGANGTIFVNVPSHTVSWSLEDAPLSPRLRNALRKKGYRRLGDLHGKTFLKLLRIQGCGVGSVTELKRFLDRLQAGEFDRIEAHNASEAPRVVVERIDEFCAKLTKRDRDILFRRLGAQGEPFTLAEIAKRYRLTRERVRQIVNRRIGELRCHGGPPFLRLLSLMMHRCIDNLCPLSPEFLARCMRRARGRRACSPSFYVRVIAELQPQFPLWLVRQERHAPNATEAKITAEIKQQLTGRVGPTPLREVFQLVKSQREFGSLTPAQFLRALKNDASICTSFSRNCQVLVRPPVLQPVQCVRYVLTNSDRPLSLADIRLRARRLWGDRALTVPSYRLARLLQPEQDIHPLGEEHYGLRKHVHVPEVAWARMRDDVADVLQREGWSVSTFDILHRGRFDWGKAINAYELAAVLRGDPRFIDLGGCLFSLAVPVRTVPLPALKTLGKAPLVATN